MTYPLSTGITYFCKIDWNNDGNFSNADSDVSSRVVEADIKAGFSDPVKHIADIGTMKLTLNNYDQKFSVLNVTGPLYGKIIPNIAIQFWVYTPYNYNSGLGVWNNYDAFEQFTGYIKSIRTKAAKNGGLVTVIDCEDGLGLLKANENFLIPLITNVDSNFLSAAIINGGMNGCSYQTAMNFTTQPTNGDTITFSAIPYFNTAAYFSVQSGALVTGVSITNPPGGVASIGVSSTAGFYVGQYIRVNNELLYITSIGGSTLNVNLNQFNTNSNGATLSIGSPVYLYEVQNQFTFVTSLSGNINEVVIGSSLANSLYNFLAANNQVRYWFDNNGVSHDTGGPGVGYSSNINPIGTYVCNPFLMNTDGTISTYTDVNGYMVFIGLLRDTSKNQLLQLGIHGSYFTNHAITAIALNQFTQGIGSGTNAFLAQPFNPGNARNTYALVGDTPKTKSPGQINNNAMSELEKVAIAEYGKIYYRPSSVTLAAQVGGEDNKGFVLKSLLDLYSYYNLSGSAFTDLGQAAIYDAIVDRDKVITQSLMTYHPRTISQPGAILGQIANVESVPGKSGGERWAGVIKLPQGGARTIRIEYKEPVSQKQLGGMKLITPLVPYTDFVINDKQDGKGYDYTNVNPPVCYFSVVNNGTNADITIRNIALGTLYFTKLQVRGTAIYNFDQSVQRTEGPLILSGFNNTLTEDIQLPIDGVVVSAYTQWTQNKYGSPTARLTEDVDFKNLIYVASNIGYTALVPSINMMQPITLSDPQVGITNGKFLIIGYSKTFKQSGSVDFKVRLEALEPFAVFTLDDTTYGVLDNTTDVLGA